MDIFGRVASKIKNRVRNMIARLQAYIKRLLFPLYLFPIKLLTYSAYYLLKFAIKLILAILGLIFDCLIFPFRSLKNFLKAIVYLVVVIYLFASLAVIADYIQRQYGSINKMICRPGVTNKLKNSVVRIVGESSEGSGFFISPNQVLTNFHVIDGEPSPKIIFPDGQFVTPVQITGNKEADLAALFTKNDYPDMVLDLLGGGIGENETLLATGYALGTEIVGKATVVKGNFIDYRSSRKDPVGYFQTNISLVDGMSGGPLTDQCGKLVGINTMGLAGLSLFIDAVQAKGLSYRFTDQEIQKIEVDPSLSPEDAVYAFYTYLKARRMQDGFNLLSQKYLEKTNFEEWTARFTNILDVEVIKTERYEKTKDTAFVKFITKDWVDGEVEEHFYEGTWKTIQEDGVYKMLQSKIKEVFDPSWDWFYE